MTMIMQHLMRWRACWRKKQYTTRDQAEEAAEWVKEKYNSNQEPYQCPYCHQYHLATVKER